MWGLEEDDCDRNEFTGTMSRWPMRCSRPCRSASSGRPSIRSCSASTTSTTTRPATPSSGPAASLAGRSIGQDFAGVDGWRMYHGRGRARLPPAPAPRVRDGHVRAQGLRRPQRLAGRRGPLRPRRRAVDDRRRAASCTAEMFPLLDHDGPNTLELFQIWLNLPAADKMVEPHFTMLWDHDIPTVIAEPTDDGAIVEITVIAGLARRRPTAPAPPPNSWASTAEADVAIWHLAVRPGRSWTMPAAATVTIRTALLYVFEGSMAHGRRRTPRRRRRVRCSTVTSRSTLVAGDGGVPRCWCCRPGRSASRSPSTARS